MGSTRFVTTPHGFRAHDHRLEPQSTKRSIYQRLLQNITRQPPPHRLIPVYVPKDENLEATPVKTSTNAEACFTEEELFGKPCKTVGSGGFGTVTVYRKIAPSGEYGRLHQQVTAVKIFHVRSDEPSGIRHHRALRELRITDGLQHFNVVRITGVFQAVDTQMYYQTMEFCEAGDLLSLLQSSFGRGLEAEEANCFFKQLMHGIQYIHNVGIAHCDIKPENLLLTARGVVKIADFGCSKYLPESKREQSDTTKRLISGARGSSPYSAPEEDGEISYDGKAADVWSCGVVYLVMRTGYSFWYSATEEDDEYLRYRRDRRTEEGYSPIEWLNQVPCKNIIYSLLDPQPQRRMTADQLVHTEWCSGIDTCI